MNNQIQAYSNNFPSMEEINTIQLMAKAAHESGLYNVIGGQARILMILLTGKELGISPMIALNGGIWNIQGKIEVSARCMNSMIRRAGHSINIVRSDSSKCTLLGKRKDGDSFECSFSIEDASKAGLTTRDNWKKYPEDMLYNRCMSRLARRLFPDVIGESYVRGEISDASAIDVSFEDVTNSHNEKIETIKDVLNSHIPQELKLEKEIEKPSENILSDEKVQNLASLLSQTNDEYVKSFKENIKKYWNADEYSQIPNKFYNGLILNIQNHIKENNQGKENV